MGILYNNDGDKDKFIKQVYKGTGSKDDSGLFVSGNKNKLVGQGDDKFSYMNDINWNENIIHKQQGEYNGRGVNTTMDFTGYPTWSSQAANNEYDPNSEQYKTMVRFQRDMGNVGYANTGVNTNYVNSEKKIDGKYGPITHEAFLEYYKEPEKPPIERGTYYVPQKNYGGSSIQGYTEYIWDNDGQKYISNHKGASRGAVGNGFIYDPYSNEFDKKRADKLNIQRGGFSADGKYDPNISQGIPYIGLDNVYGKGAFTDKEYNKFGRFEHYLNDIGEADSYKVISQLAKGVIPKGYEQITNNKDLYQKYAKERIAKEQGVLTSEVF